MAEPLADGVVRLGTSQVNWYLVEDGGGVTVVDAGLPRYRPQLDEGLLLLGRTPADVRAVVLTHGHGDHIGTAEAIRMQLGVPVLVHGEDRELATTLKQPKREASWLPYLRYRQGWRLLAAFAAGGWPRKVAEVQTYRDGDELDVPGRPRVIHTPGHTNGHCALLFERHRMLAVGDVLCSLNPLTGRRGPQPMPRALNLSTATALDSLARIEQLDAPLTLFGHGEPWREGPAAAVASARALGPS
jgi:glyoxylase-like metal-dependent hydrolase (beta-lactamase superfamily II)